MNVLSRYVCVLFLYLIVWGCYFPWRRGICMWGGFMLCVFCDNTRVVLEELCYVCKLIALGRKWKSIERLKAPFSRFRTSFFAVPLYVRKELSWFTNSIFCRRRTKKIWNQSATAKGNDSCGGLCGSLVSLLYSLWRFVFLVRHLYAWCQRIFAWTPRKRRWMTHVRLAVVPSAMSSKERISSVKIAHKSQHVWHSRYFVHL